jgi:hypothetical protein
MYMYILNLLSDILYNYKLIFGLNILTKYMIDQDFVDIYIYK